MLLILKLLACDIILANYRSSWREPWEFLRPRCSPLRQFTVRVGFGDPFARTYAGVRRASCCALIALVRDCAEATKLGTCSLRSGAFCMRACTCLDLRQRQECAPTVRGSAIDLCETLIQEIQRLLCSLAIGYLDPTDKFITAGAENSQPVARKSSDYAGVAHYLVPAANCL
jgi:hypothetical protein